MRTNTAPTLNQNWTIRYLTMCIIEVWVSLATDKGLELLSFNDKRHMYIYTIYIHRSLKKSRTNIQHRLSVNIYIYRSRLCKSCEHHFYETCVVNHNQTIFWTPSWQSNIAALGHLVTDYSNVGPRCTSARAIALGNRTISKRLDVFGNRLRRAQPAQPNQPGSQRSQN